MTEEKDRRTLLKVGLEAGLKRGWSGFLLHLDFLLKPLMGFLSLPPTAALPLIIGMLSGVYGGIAAMAVFILMAHSLISATRWPFPAPRAWQLT